MCAAQVGARSCAAVRRRINSKRMTTRIIGITPEVRFGGDQPPLFIAGPCVIESRVHALAIARTLRALREFELAGVPTTIRTAVDVLGSRGFVSGDYSTDFLSELGLVAA